MNVCHVSTYVLWPKYVCFKQNKFSKHAFTWHGMYSHVCDQFVHKLLYLLEGDADDESDDEYLGESDDESDDEYDGTWGE